MDKNWIENIYYMINAYSNIERQRKAWLGLSDREVSSYSEDLNLLFDSFFFDDFIKVWKEEGRDDTVWKEMAIFRDMLNTYHENISPENDLPDRDVLEDPNWLLVVNQAKKVIKAWDEYNGGK